ncbi:conserved exported hypothetical protein [Flavobacterium sp. 9AF]|uniref:protease complex subunit PrcB family protein n=1 Tax=Flavobacterium sp. 9AF TaxID=2653142 RepID=UPI0012F37568|nr:protease complex subunit PrcB family protein [Flavobacterium sp. 9AF]VXB62843.1 conserved exported hypothetical protein [Flavobacterium sp. 9AF]
MKLLYINLLFLSFLSFLSCCTQKQSDRDTANMTLQIKELKDDLNYQVIYTSEYGGKDEFSYEIIDDKEVFFTKIDELNISDQINNISNLEFNQKKAIILYLGQKNTGGYAIDIERIEFNNEELIIYSKKIFPKKGENVTMALTNPYCIAIIPKANKYTIK